MTQPRLILQSQHAHVLCQHWLAGQQGVVFLQGKIGRPESFVTRYQLLADGNRAGHRPAGGERVKICPKRATYKADALQHSHLALQPDEAQPLANLLQTCVRRVKLLGIVLMVAGHKNHRTWPVGETTETKIRDTQACQRRILLIGADVASQYQHISPSSWTGHKIRI